MSDAIYTMGPPKRPSIRQNNGFFDPFAKRAPNGSHIRLFEIMGLAMPYLTQVTLARKADWTITNASHAGVSGHPGSKQHPSSRAPIRNRL